jgi:single-strand DNA-binding protein
MALNHITIMGRMTRDPELRYTKTEKAVASFTLAVDRDFGEGVDFINCVAWEKVGEFVSKYFEKGKVAIVAGKLQMREYTDREGNKRTAAEVVASNVYFGDSKRNESAKNEQPRHQNNEPAYGNASDLIDRYPGVAKRARFAELDDDGDLPF